MKPTKPKILFYDIETTPLRAWIWRLGEQRILPGQLDEIYSDYDIICITYCWNDGKRAKAFDWGYDKQDSSKMIEKFDRLVQQADVTIGKNSDKFDVKHINTRRMMHNLPPLPDWSLYTDDVEKQFRKNFVMPSFSLDYISSQLGLGGKIKMKFQDWIDIVEKKNKSSFHKMIKYGKKDVEDTRKVYDRIEKYIIPRYNASVNKTGMACRTCGSTKIHKNGTRQAGKTTYQRFYCNSHGGYAGRATILKSGKFGKMG